MMIVKTLFREDDWELFSDEVSDLVKLYGFPNDLAVYDTEEYTSCMFILKWNDKTEEKKDDVD